MYLTSTYVNDFEIYITMFLTTIHRSCFDFVIIPFMIPELCP